VSHDGYNNREPGFIRARSRNKRENGATLWRAGAKKQVAMRVGDAQAVTLLCAALPR